LIGLILLIPGLIGLSLGVFLWKGYAWARILYGIGAGSSVVYKIKSYLFYNHIDYMIILMPLEMFIFWYLLLSKNVRNAYTNQ